jgi:hypothetical protein
MCWCLKAYIVYGLSPNFNSNHSYARIGEKRKWHTRGIQPTNEMRWNSTCHFVHNGKPYKIIYSLPKPNTCFFWLKKKILEHNNIKKYRDENYHRFIKNFPPKLNITQVVTNFYYPPVSFALLPNKKWISFLFEFTKGLYNKKMTNPLWIFTIFITSKL